MASIGFVMSSTMAPFYCTLTLTSCVRDNVSTTSKFVPRRTSLPSRSLFSNNVFNNFRQRKRHGREQIQMSLSSTSSSSNDNNTEKEKEKEKEKEDWFQYAVKCHGNAIAPNSHCQFTKNSSHVNGRRRRRRRRRFFEGWYLRIVSYDKKSSYALIFALEGPNLGTFQIIDDNENRLYISQLNSETAKFHADDSNHSWSFSHWSKDINPNPTNCSYESRSCIYGWYVDQSHTHGRVLIDQKYICQWSFDFQSTLSWGPRGIGNSKHTGTWLSNLSLFEPAYQIMMAHGRIINKTNNNNQYIQLPNHKHKIDVSNSTVYMEKNWGQQFPPRWFWIQCNTFDHYHYEDLCIVALGAIRKIIFTNETVGMITIHYLGNMYEFANWSAHSINWNVIWGNWQMESISRNGYKVKLIGLIPDHLLHSQGISILGPTRNGMQFTMRDTMKGFIHVILQDPNGNILVDAQSHSAQLECGGEPWQEGRWIASVPSLKQPLRGFVNAFNGPKVHTSS